jgi:hypothetical protein
MRHHRRITVAPAMTEEEENFIQVFVLRVIVAAAAFFK